MAGTRFEEDGIAMFNDAGFKTLLVPDQSATEDIKQTLPTAGGVLATSGTIDASIITERSTSATLTNKTLTGTNNIVTASLLKSLTTEVSVSAAAAPSAGQVLTATGGSTATWQAGGIPVAEKGAANGVATLGADSKVPNAQLSPLVNLFVKPQQK